MKKPSSKTTTLQKTYHKEIIVKPAKRLLKALKGTKVAGKSQGN